jgi:hypothetical protein
MKSLLAVLSLATGVGVALLVPEFGTAAVLFCAALALLAGLIITRAPARDRNFLLQLFVAGLLARVLVGTLIHSFELQGFFGGDAITYDDLGEELVKFWHGQMSEFTFLGMMGPFMSRNWGMIYVVGGIYYVLGRNPLAVQFLSAVLGAATAPIIFLCAQHIFRNSRVARISALFVAFYPSLILWSSQGLKDGPLVFLLALAMLATLKLGERLSVKYLLVLAPALFGISTLRFYVLFMMVAAIGGAFLIGKNPLSVRTVLRQVVVVAALGVAMTYLGVLRSATTQFETFGNLETVQRSRQDQVARADSGFGQDVDVSTTTGALSTIPLGMVYLLFAPFPWQLANLRQSITLPEMLVWWASFPLLVMGVWFTLKYRMRTAMPIIIFTMMLTLAYSIFQGNIGTAYRQRSQLLIFYFIFVAVGFVLVRERREERRQQLAQEPKGAGLPARARAARGAQGPPVAAAPRGVVASAAAEGRRATPAAEKWATE